MYYQYIPYLFRPEFNVSSSVHSNTGHGETFHQILYHSDTDIFNFRPPSATWDILDPTIELQCRIHRVFCTKNNNTILTVSFEYMRDCIFLPTSGRHFEFGIFHRKIADIAFLLPETRYMVQ